MIISITNQKGGVGKTTTAQAMGAILTEKEYKVLLVDLDPQGNLSYSVNADTENNTLYELLKKEVLVEDTIQKTSTADIIPANILLSGAEQEFTKTGREYLLAEILLPLRSKYDFIIIDTPPALSILTINAFTASDKIIIPMGADMFSLQGVGQLGNTISQVKKYCNKNLSVEGILLTRYNPRTLLSKDLAQIVSDVATKLESKVFKTYIRSSISIQEAQTEQENIFKYAPDANAQLDYKKFVEEFIKENKNGN